MTNIERKWFIFLLSSEIAEVNVRILLFCSEIRRKYNKNINFIKHILFTNEETTRSPDLNPLDFAFTWRIYFTVKTKSENILKRRMLLNVKI